MSSGAVETSEEWDAIQKDLDGLEKWAHGNFMWFNETNARHWAWVGATSGINTGWGMNG